MVNNLLYFFSKMYFFILLINIFIKLSIESLISNNRIEGAIKYAISSLEKIPGKNDTIVLKYIKYEIVLNNFRLMNPDLTNKSIINNASFQNNTDNNSYFLENLQFSFIYDTKIIQGKEFSFEEKDNFIEINCQNINYKYDFIKKKLYFDSFNISESIINIIDLDNGIAPLDYFKEAREKKECLCKIKSKENYIKEKPDIFLMNYFKSLLLYYISEVEKNDLLLVYDIKNIFSDTLKKIETKNILDDNYKFEYIKMKKIIIPFDEIETFRYDNDNTLLIIHQLKFYGIFNLSIFKNEFKFDFELNKEKGDIIELYDRSLNFSFEKILINVDFDFKEENKTKIIENLNYTIFMDYSKVLLESIINYYNHIYN